MSAHKNEPLRPVAVSMISKVSRSEITRHTMESVIKDNKLDKHIKLETAIRYLEPNKNAPVEDYMKEAEWLLRELLPQFEGDKEYFVPWTKFLCIAYVHKLHKASKQKEEEAFKRGIEGIMVKLLLKDNKISSIDWRIARKILSLNDHFSLPQGNLEQVKEDILKSFKHEIDIALEHLLWPKESLFVEYTKTILFALLKCFDSPDEPDKKDLLEAILCGRFDKQKFKLKNSLILGEDGGLYVLLNYMNQQQQDALVAEERVTRDYLTDKIKAKDKDKGDKIVLGTGGFGTVKFALSLLRTKSLPGEIICVKKTRSFQDLGGSFKPTALEQVTESTLSDYFTNDKAQAIYSPFILDMTLVIPKSVIKDDGKDHRKGYLMMEVIPQNTATRIFADERYQTWEYQKPYLLDVFESTQKLLESDIAMTDLKPDNTLNDIDTRKATIIDLGGSVKVENNKDLSAFDIAKYTFQSTPEFRAPELGGSQGIVNMHKSLAYACGKIIEAVTHESDYDKQAISQLINKLTASKPEARLSIAEAITEIKGMGEDSYKKNVIFCHYISKVKDRLENKKSAISINEDIDKTEKLLITLNATSSDPSKSKNLKTEDLFKKIDNFFSISEKSKQVMAIFGQAGSGKSIALQLKFIKAVRAWYPGRPLPIYFSLANGLDLEQIVRTLNTELDTHLSLKDLDGQHLYIDSFDEGLGIENKKETLIKDYFSQLGSPKILITCPSDYLEPDSYHWFAPESKELEICYVAPINYNGHQGLPEMIKKYVNYSMKEGKSTSIQQHTTEDYLKRLKELQLTDLINTGFMFLMIMEVLFKLQHKQERKVNKVDVYANYISHYQSSQIARLDNQEQKRKLEEMTHFSESSRQLDLCSSATELGKYLACQMHLRGQARLGESDKLFAALGYDSSLLLKHQSIIHMLKLLPLKIVTTQSGKRLISNQEVKIGFIHETIKNYYLLEAIKSEIERKGQSLILASKSIVHEYELMKLIVLAMKDNPQLTTSFLQAIENSKHDKSTASTTHASNSISLLVAAQHSFAGCDLSNIAVKGANIVHGIFHKTNLGHADLSSVDMSNVNLIEASLNGADMRGVNFSVFPDLVGHTSSVLCVSFSLDGKFLASGGSIDKTINIWNSTSGELVQTLEGHTGVVNSVSISPDGKFLASGSKDQTIKIWNSTTGELVQNLNGHTGEVNSISFSADGKFLASGSKDQTIKIWSSTSGELVQTLNGHTDAVNSVSISPDGKFLVSGSNDQTIKIWNSTTGELVQTIIKGHRGEVNIVSFSPDGKFLASGSKSDTIKIWNSTTGKLVQALNEQETLGVNSLSFSPDSKFLATGDDYKTIMIWNSTTGELVQTLNGHTGGVNSVSFSPDGKFLASASKDQTIKIWNSTVGELVQTLNGHTNTVSSVSFSPDGKFLRSQCKILKIWNSTTGELVQTFNELPELFNNVSFSPDGKFLASGSMDKTIKIWNSTSGELVQTQTLKGHTGVVNSVSISPDGKFLASGSEDQTIKLWNSTTGELVQTLNGHTGVVNSVTFSPDGKFIASGSVDKTIKIWNSTTGELVQTLDKHTGDVNSISFSPDGKFLANGSGSRDKTIKIWNSTTGELVQTLKGHTDEVYCVSFSPDGKFLASGSGKYDPTIKIWNSTSGELVQTLKGHIAGVFSVSFSPDGKFLASGSFDQTIKIYESIGSVFVLKRILAATLSPLLADGAILEQTKISQNNKLTLTQKGADTTSSVIDNTINQRDISSVSNHMAADQLSQSFFDGNLRVSQQQNQSSKFVALSVNPPIHLSRDNTHKGVDTTSSVIENKSKVVEESKRSSCCNLF